MGIRRRSRELAMQALYCMDIRKDSSALMLKNLCAAFPPSEKAESFFVNLIQGVLASKDDIDRLIERFSSNWKITRMSCVDRNILRLAVYELIYLQDIPPKVSINEAIDVGKKYGTEESGAFINGILDSIRVAVEKGEIHRPAGVRPRVEPEAALE